jgi:predicted amidohydrolase YtcJ
MKKMGLLIAAAGILTLLPFRLWAQGAVPTEVAKHGYAEMIVVNGKIVSMDDQGYNTSPGHVYEAMAVKDGRVLALGTSARIRTMADSDTKVVDVAGRTVIPGIIDTHNHMFGDPATGQTMGIKWPDNGINIQVVSGKDREATRLKVENAIKDAITKVKPGEWVRVGIDGNPQEGVSATRVFSWVEKGEFEPKERLDRLAPGNPVMVQQASRATMNSAGYELARKYLPHFDDYDDQEVTDVPEASKKGVLSVGEEVAITWNIWYRNQPISLLAELIRRQWEAAAAHGITSFGSRIYNPKTVDAVTFLHREGEQPIRYGMLYEVHRKPNNPEFTRQFYTMTGNLVGIGDDYLWIHGVASELWDSSFPEACLGPDLPAPPEIKMREKCPKPGEMYWDTLQNAVEAGWRPAGVHGVASDGVRRFTQLLERAMKNTGMTAEDIRRMRPTVEHAEALGKKPDLMAKIKELGIIISVDPPRLVREKVYLEDYGPGAEEFMMPVKTWLDQGLKVVGQFEEYTAIGSNLNLLITRVANGKVVLPEERLDRVTVLKLYTTWAPQYLLKEKVLGTLEPGKFADFVILDKDYFTIPVDQIPKIVPQMTVVGGIIRHLEPGLANQLGMQPVGFLFPKDYQPWDRSSAPSFF